MVVVEVTITTGMSPLSWWEEPLLMDDQGRQFSESWDAMSLGLGYEQQPEESLDGQLVFDVPASAEAFDGLWFEDEFSYEPVFVDFTE